MLLSLSQQALDEKCAAMEEKDHEIHQLQLSLREKERDLERLTNLLSHNEETIDVRSHDPYISLFPAIMNTMVFSNALSAHFSTHRVLTAWSRRRMWSCNTLLTH